MKGGEEQSIIVPARCNAPSLLMWGGLPSVKRNEVCRGTRSGDRQKEGRGEAEEGGETSGGEGWRRR